MKIIWLDPSPIEGNDYEVVKLIKEDEDTYYIEYNDGNSEAQVPADELRLVE